MNGGENGNKVDKKYKACYEDRKLQQYIKNDNKCIKELNEIKEIKYIGSGGFGYVYEVEKKGKRYALKIVDINEKSNINDVMNELKGFCRTNYLKGISDNFVTIKEWIYCISPEKYGNKFIFRKDNESDKSFYMLLELCNYDLKTFLKINDRLSFYQYKCIMFQLIYGMSAGSYFLNFSHNDIKS